MELNLCWYFLISRCDSNFIELDKFAHSSVLVCKDALTYITTFLPSLHTRLTSDIENEEKESRGDMWEKVWAGIKLGCCRTDKNNHTLAGSVTFAVIGCPVWQNIDIEFGIFTSNVFKSPFYVAQIPLLPDLWWGFVSDWNIFTCKKKSRSSESLF